jgi:hypothetical protein
MVREAVDIGFIAVQGMFVERVLMEGWFFSKEIASTRNQREMRIMDSPALL